MPEPFPAGCPERRCRGLVFDNVEKQLYVCGGAEVIPEQVEFTIAEKSTVKIGRIVAVL